MFLFFLRYTVTGAAVVLTAMQLSRVICVSLCQSYYRPRKADGIFNMHNDLCVGCAQEGETGADKSVQVLTQKN